LETISFVVSAIIILLLIVLVVTIFKYPRDFFVVIPSGILKIGQEKFLFYVSIVTIPVWVPLYFLDNHFKWGIFNHRFFTLFNQKRISAEETDVQSDMEYPEIKRIEVQFSHFSTYFISTIKEDKKLIDCLEEGLESLEKGSVDFECLHSGELTVVKASKLELYEFHYLIQWLDNELVNSKNFGFALDSKLSFFGMDDKKTLNNIIGKTSTGDSFAYSLLSAHEDYLSCIDERHVTTGFSTKFFEELVKKAGPSG
jgi:hypothetical protein